MILIESLHHISLGSSNLSRSVEFYRDILDFELLEESETFVVMSLESVTIRLNMIDGYQSRITNPGEVSLSFILDVDDFTDAITEFEEKDLEIIKGPVPIEGGESLLIADPDGNLLEFFYNE